MMKPDLFLNAVDFARQVAETFKAEISLTSLVGEILKISLQISLVVVDAVARVKVKIYKPKPQLLSENQYLVLI